MEFTQLKAMLDNKETIPNLLVFTGEEREVQLQYIKRIDPKANTVEDVTKLPQLMSYGNLFKQKKTYVVNNSKGALDLTGEQLKSLTKYNRLIITFPELDKRSKFYKAVKDYIVEFNKFNPDQLSVYIMRNYNLPQDVAYALAIYCDCEVSRIDNEADKLKMLGKPPTVDLVQEVVTPPLEDAIFEMIDGVLGRDHERVFEILDDMFELNESPIKIISILYTKVKQVFLVQSMYDLGDKEIADKTMMTYWQVKMTRNLCNRFSVEQLVEILKQVQSYEFKMKTGQLEPKTGIVSLFTRILNA